MKKSIFALLFAGFILQGTQVKAEESVELQCEQAEGGKVLCSSWDLLMEILSSLQEVEPEPATQTIVPAGHQCEEDSVTWLCRV